MLATTTRTIIYISAATFLAVVGVVRSDRWPGKPRIYGHQCTACNPFPKDLIDDTLTTEKTIDKWTRRLRKYTPQEALIKRFELVDKDAFGFKNKIHVLQTVNDRLGVRGYNRRRNKRQSESVSWADARRAVYKCNKQRELFYSIKDKVRNIIRHDMLGEVRKLLLTRDEIARKAYRQVLQTAHFARKVQYDFLYRARKGPRNPVLDRDRYLQAQRDIRTIQRVFTADQLRISEESQKSVKVRNEIMEYYELRSSVQNYLAHLERRILTSRPILRLMDLEQKSNRVLQETFYITTGRNLEIRLDNIKNKLSQLFSLSDSGGSSRQLLEFSEAALLTAEGHNEAVREMLKKVKKTVREPRTTLSSKEQTDMSPLFETVNNHLQHLKSTKSLISRLLSPTVKQFVPLLNYTISTEDSIKAERFINSLNQWFYMDLYLLLQHCPVPGHNHHTTAAPISKSTVPLHVTSSSIPIVSPPATQPPTTDLIDEGSASGARPTDFTFADDEDVHARSFLTNENYFEAIHPITDPRQVLQDTEVVPIDIGFLADSPEGSGSGHRVLELPAITQLPPITTEGIENRPRTFCESVRRIKVGPTDFEGMRDRLKQISVSAMMKIFHSEDYHMRAVANRNRINEFTRRINRLFAGVLNSGKAETYLEQLQDKLSLLHHPKVRTVATIDEKVKSVAIKLRHVNSITEKVKTLGTVGNAPRGIPGMIEVTYLQKNVSTFTSLQDQLEEKVKQLKRQQIQLRSSINKLKESIKTAKKKASTMSVHLDAPVSLTIPQESKMNVYTSMFSLSLRTLLPDVVLLNLVNDANVQTSENMVLSIKAGKPHLLWIRDGEKVELGLPKQINDGQWYKVTVHRIRRTVFLRTRSLDQNVLPIDGYQEASQEQRSWEDTSTLPSSVLVGNKIQVGVFGSNQQFDGCMANLTINTQPIVIWSSTGDMRACTTNVPLGARRPTSSPSESTTTNPLDEIETKHLTTFSSTPKLVTPQKSSNENFTTGWLWGKTNGLQEVTTTPPPITTKQTTMIASVTTSTTTSTTTPSTSTSPTTEPTTRPTTTTTTEPTTATTTTTLPSPTTSTPSTTTQATTTTTTATVTTEEAKSVSAKAVTFDGSAYMTLPVIEEFYDFSDFTATMTFVTTAADGVIFYALDKGFFYDGFIVFRIKDGHIEVAFSKTVTTKNKYNDGRPHTLKVVSTDEQLSLTVDGNDEQTLGDAIGSTSEIDAMYLGGAPSDEHDNTGVEQNFAGCISAFVINGETIAFESTSGRIKISQTCQSNS